MMDAERRYVCRLIDLAVERCEDGNLNELLEVPRWIADLVAHLQASAGVEPLIPSDTVTAHEELLNLRQRYMPDPPDGPRDRTCSGLPCAGCGRPMMPNCTHSTCSRCRPLELAAQRAAKVLGQAWP